MTGDGLRKRLPVATMSVDRRLPRSVVMNRARGEPLTVLFENVIRTPDGIQGMPRRHRFHGVAVDDDVFCYRPNGGRQRIP